MTQEEIVLKDIERMKKLAQKKKISFNYIILDSKGKNVTEQITKKKGSNKYVGK